MPAKTYQERKESGDCTYPGCKLGASDVSSLCADHHEDAKRRQRESGQRRRDARRDAGLCAWCPGDAPSHVKPPETMCLPCRIRRRRTTGIAVGVRDNYINKDQRIAKATRKHADGRTRYHGTQKRGNQPRIQLDEQDLGYARDMLQSGEEGLHIYESPEVKALPRIQREDVKSAALHQLARAQGHIEDVLERRGHFKDKHGKQE